MLPHRAALLPALAVAALLFPVADAPAADVLPERSVEPVVLTGAQLPDWSRLAAVGTADPAPGPGVTVRDAHNGVVAAPPDPRPGLPVDELVAYRWDGDAFVPIPVQVDQRFPYFLANANSDFSIYSGTDVELTYQWDTEGWKMTDGECTKAYAPGDGPTSDPVPTLDDDDEIVFMASDAGERAPADAEAPAGASERHDVVLTDPLHRTVTAVHLFRSASGPAIEGTYVDYRRDGDADQWIDAASFAAGDPEQLGSSNGGYGPNIGGTVCDPDGTVRTSTDRFARDGVRVRTASYEWRATGRWMVRELHVARLDEEHGRHDKPKYGPDLIDRWKGRAFQQSPDSSISVVGFEDEQVNWEANSTLLGERAGPVRAIREVWGADSGTNVTKTETFYRDAITYRYRMRVHPIPPDGLYTSWDYNHAVVDRYYNALKPDGVAIDGVNDDVGNIDSIAGRPAFFDAPDPTFDLPIALLRWEQVSGVDDAGSLVYVLENKGATSFQNPLVVPYYRDDKCLDDGTGDDPVARPWPGEASTDQRVRDGYSALAGGVPYEELTCDQRQGAWGAHGVHFFATGDTDNAFVGAPVPVNEVDAQQWQFAVPTASAGPVGEPYAQIVRAPLVVAVVPAAG